ncbi:cytochrome P450 [Mycolicibacterium elephantis]|uniref:Cytochrome P450 n=1 Tax=Mycolicibacterium elephantis DSM 44368 TaxID=1335622 RepID=A0A439DVX5_9MYCO|nr:cytochrome P450 [Mycolicibacterium elephantis]MCV7219940.1 cytochrome P450 [Mycolicibacterium elephantis]RWA21275.1 cytochrome P450 [Mycolicibacterium elephantis DSM 44368]
MTKSDFGDIDFFTSPVFVPDPHPYFEYLRSQGRAVREPHHGVVAVTGYEETLEVFKDAEQWSNCVAVGGPFPPLPFTPEGDDIRDQIDAHRTQMPLHEHMVAMDPPNHTRARSILSRLLTPSRLKANQDFLWELADSQLDEFVDSGECEFLTAYSKPFSLLAIADLLGVPREDHKEFRDALANPHLMGNIEGDAAAINPLEFLDEKFSAYIEERRAHPGDDVLSDLATATYPDGSQPAVTEVVRTASFLFGAGQETTAKLLGAALLILCERPELQQRLRDDPTLVPIFIEEALRMESPVKTEFRLAVRSTTLGGVDIPAGTTVMISAAAANRDPDRFECPHEFRLDRKNVREQIAFARGAHSCPGAPLARVEGRVSLERILARMTDIDLDERFHGPPDARRLTYEPTYILRGLTDLHLRFTPVS